MSTLFGGGGPVDASLDHVAPSPALLRASRGAEDSTPSSAPRPCPAAHGPGLPKQGTPPPRRVVVLARCVAWVAALVVFNYLGYEYPVLWSAEERSDLLSALGTAPQRSSGLAAAIGDASAHGNLDAPPDADALHDPSLAGPLPTHRRRLTPQTEPHAVLQQQPRAQTDPVDASLAPAVGSAGESPYVGAWQVSVAGQRECRRVFPRHLQRPSQGPIAFVGDLLRRRQRLLLVIPRHGLGNSLRGFVSAYVYAALSARRLVRFHGAQHARVLETLCHAFECGGEAISSSEAPGGAVGLTKELDVLSPVDLNSKFRASPQVLASLRSTWGLFVTRSPHFFDGFWRNFPAVSECVYAAFGCSSAWCVHSRAIHDLLGPPTPLLQSVIQHVLMRHHEHGQPDVPALAPPDLFFDLALHLRTRPAAIESKEGTGSGGAAKSKAALMKIGCGHEETDEASQYLKSCLWDCLGGIILKLDAKRTQKGRPLQILLATDNEALRPAFVERLSEYGTVFYSSGVIAHSSKSASGEAERLPTMAEFHLMSRSHTILEAGSYVSTFAYFSGLRGNGTLAGIDWRPDGSCGLRIVHKGEPQHS